MCGSVLVSASLYAGAVNGGSLAWIASLIWPIPLWYVMATCSLRSAVLYGALWGLVTYLLQVWDFFVGLTSFAQGPGWAQCLAPVVIICYLMMITSIWFATTVFVSRKIPTHFGAQEALFVGSTSGYIYFVQYAAFFFVYGVWEGYPLATPLAALLVYPPVLGLLPYIGGSGMVLLQMLPAAIVVGICRSGRSVFWLICAGVVSVVWICSWLIGVSHQQHDIRLSWLDRVVVVAQQYPLSTSIDKIAASVRGTAQDVQQRFPLASCIIFPESSIYRTNIPLKWDKLLGVDMHMNIIIGGFRYDPEAGGCRNTVFLWGDGRCNAFYDKQHVVPCSEYIPVRHMTSLLRSVYFMDCDEIIPSNNVQRVWEIAPGAYVVPTICSELFYARRPRDVFKDVPLLALCNDTWAPVSVRKKMLLSARLRAIEWTRPILYCTHTSAQQFGVSGREYSVTYVSALFE